jgi:hypothetical protein
MLHSELFGMGALACLPCDPGRSSLSTGLDYAETPRRFAVVRLDCAFGVFHSRFHLPSVANLQNGGEVEAERFANFGGKHFISAFALSFNSGWLQQQLCHRL